MAQPRIIRTLGWGVTLALVAAACKPDPPDDLGDAGGMAAATGGSPAGGAGGSAGGSVASTGGNGGGASVPECEIVAALPEMGSDCTQAELGESWCLPNGDRCVCQHDTWYCNTRCATDYPTVPATNASCAVGAACNYPSGEHCTCIAGRWLCLGRTGASCPANYPVTGDPCLDSQIGNACETYPVAWDTSGQQGTVICQCGDYPGYPDISPIPPGNATWTCYLYKVNGTKCPATQPSYDFGTKCPLGGGLCRYGSTECLCMSYYDGAMPPDGNHYYPWICGLATYPQGYPIM